MGKTVRDRGPIGSVIYDMRVSAGWTQKELAERAGLGRDYIAQVETNLVRNPGAERMMKIAHAFGVQPEALFKAAGMSGEKPEAPNLSTAEDVLRQALLLLPPAIPVYIDYMVALGRRTDRPVGHTYISRERHGGQGLRAWLCDTDAFAPIISRGSVVVVDRTAALSQNDYVLGQVDAQLIIGRLRSVNDHLWVENNEGRWPFENCLDAARIIRIEQDFLPLS